MADKHSETVRMEDTDTGWQTQTDSQDRRHTETVRMEDT